jgi:hypothetical protein
MTTSAQLRAIAVDALIGNTAAGANVFSPRDISTWEGDFPFLIVTAPDEEMESFGRQGAPAFTVTSTLHVQARVEQAALDNDMGAVLAQGLLETIREQIKAALINYTPLMQLLQQFSFVRSSIQVGTSDDTDKHLGQLNLHLGMEFVQSAENFWQPPQTTIDGMDVGMGVPDGAPQPGTSIELSA